MKNKWILLLLIVFSSQFIYAQKPFASSVLLESPLLAGYTQPVSIALLKFESDDPLDIALYKELLKNPLAHVKFLIFPFKSVEQQKKSLNLQSLSGQDTRLRKTLKKELDISIVLYGERNINGKIKLFIVDTETSNILFTGEFEESINSTIEADIVKLLLSDENTVYKNIGTLDLILNPLDCFVQIDGTQISLKENIELNAGKHSITVSKEGYYSKTDSVLIVSNQKNKYEVTLKEITGRILISCFPPATKIFRKGEVIIKKFDASTDTIDIKPGEYTIELEASGYKRKDKNLRIEENKEIILDISLEKEELPAKLSVTVNVKNSKIFIQEGEQIIKSFNGEIKDFSIKKGNYKINVSSNGYITREKNIELYAGQSLLEQFTLQKLLDNAESSNNKIDLNLSKSNRDAKLEISVSPLEAYDAQIYINNVLRGNAPLNISLLPGYYRIVVRKNTFKGLKKDITLKENETQKIHFIMEAFEDPLVGIDNPKTAPFIELIQIPGGEFLMGRNFGAADEQPQHLVQISSFSIGKFEVTFNQFSKFCISTGRDNSQYGELDNGNFPVINVTWQDAVDFCAWLSEITGGKYRLPTEAEWEYAARACKSENGFTYSGSNSFEFVGWGFTNSEQQYHTVGTKLPNELGIYDMSGNVWEWCNDWYSNSFYIKSERANPQGPLEGKIKVLRGGSWGDVSPMCSVFKRQKASPQLKDEKIGFRVVKED